jgi:hypothetical protein
LVRQNASVVAAGAKGGLRTGVEHMQVIIQLAENETCVRSHTRGAPADSVLEFGWTLAAELLALLGTEDAHQNAA